MSILCAVLSTAVTLLLLNGQSKRHMLLLSRLRLVCFCTSLVHANVMDAAPEWHLVHQKRSR